MVIDTLLGRGLLYDHRRRRGVTLHLLGALYDHGKMGFTCIGDSPSDAEALYDAAVAALT